MATKDDFKNFAYKHPELVRYIKSGEATWQKFYEIYDIYGEDSDVWNDYRKTESVSTGMAGFTEKLKNFDVNSIQEHIKTAQKALNLVQELTSKGADNLASVSKGPSIPRPINKFFED